MRIYPLNPAELTEEQMAVVFAMTSRSPEPFDEIARRVTEESASDFHERWVLDYGHASVAEHAVLHMAVEDISRLACDQLQSNRLASYTEKSSRYQVIERNSFHVPAELGTGSEILQDYMSGCQAMFDAYHSLLEKCQKELARQQPQQDAESGRAYNLRIRRQATDACRAVLPAATLTNVGMTANARTMEHAISKLMSSGLAETRLLGETLREKGREIVPTLIKYADRSEYLAKPPRRIASGTNQSQQADMLVIDEANENAAWPPQTWLHGTGHTTGLSAEPYPKAKLWRFDSNAPRNLAAALLYRSGEYNYAGAETKLRSAGADEVRRIIQDALEGMGPHGQPPREFETVSYTLELRMDYGALREFRRHRMMTPIFQPLTVREGLNMPAAISDGGPGATGLQKEFMAATEEAERLFRKLERHSPELAQYAVTHAHVQQTLVHVNLRELYHLIKLRTAKQAHESIRGPMRAVLEEIGSIHPVLLEPLIRNLAK